MKPAKIILASSSKYRQSLLRQLQLPFNCDNPDIDETAKADENATDLVQRLAEQKAIAIAIKHKHSNTYIIGSDQVATFDQHILNKPHTHENAVKQLQLCNGKAVTFHTGLCLFNCNTMTATTLHDTFNVHFRQLSQDQIEYYLRTEQPYDCAGSFKMEGLGISLFQKLEGDDPNSLIGLPLIKLNHLLLQNGIDTLNQ
ncbi:MAG: septum formation inhibitor Maf [Pseudomonadales bacterium]|nr:septum formation inhibitor Maf [Pseudomonadales bacterium]